MRLSPFSPPSEADFRLDGIRRGPDFVIDALNKPDALKSGCGWS
jgi:hypothetical protein